MRNAVYILCSMYKVGAHLVNILCNYACQFVLYVCILIIWELVRLCIFDLQFFFFPGGRGDWVDHLSYLGWSTKMSSGSFPAISILFVLITSLFFGFIFISFLFLFFLVPSSCSLDSSLKYNLVPAFKWYQILFHHKLTGVK